MTSIKESLSELSEQLDRIYTEASFADYFDFRFSTLLIREELDVVKKSFDDLKESIEFADLWEKKYICESVLDKFSMSFLKELRKTGFVVNFVQDAHGSISINLIEQVMKVFLIATKNSISRFKRKKNTTKSQNFRIPTIYISIKEQVDGVNGVFSDDGCSFLTNKAVAYKTIKGLRKIIAEFKGRLKVDVDAKRGMVLSFWLPKNTIQERVVLISNDIDEIAIESGFIDSVQPIKKVNIKKYHGRQYLQTDTKNIPILQVNPKSGLVEISEDNKIERSLGYVLLLKVADCDLAIYSAIKPEVDKLRVQDAKAFVSEDAWFDRIAVFLNGGRETIVPLVKSTKLLEVFKDKKL